MMINSAQILWNLDRQMQLASVRTSRDGLKYTYRAVREAPLGPYQTLPSWKLPLDDINWC